MRTNTHLLFMLEFFSDAQVYQKNMHKHYVCVPVSVERSIPENFQPNN